MNISAVKSRMRVLTRPDRDSNIIADPGLLEFRRHGSGVAYKEFPHQQGCWWVLHEDGTLAPYWFYELFEDISEPPEPDRLCLERDAE